MNLKKIHLILFLKPYSNWNTFNTKSVIKGGINMRSLGFKPC